MRTLTLPLKAKYFHEIARGEKTEEYRLATPFWQKRLMNRTYDQVIFTLGYPKKEDSSRRIQRAFRGIFVKTITHEHFGKDPVEVFAIQFN